MSYLKVSIKYTYYVCKTLSTPMCFTEGRNECAQANGNQEEENCDGICTLSTDDRDAGQCFGWLQNRTSISQLELRAALSMSINVLPVLIFTFPVTCNAIILYWCIQLECNCTTILKINPYLRDLFLFHCIYNPIMYIASSSEFKRACLHAVQNRILRHVNSNYPAPV